MDNYSGGQVETNKLLVSIVKNDRDRMAHRSIITYSSTVVVARKSDAAGPRYDDGAMASRGKHEGRREGAGNPTVAIVV